MIIDNKSNFAFSILNICLYMNNIYIKYYYKSNI